MDHYAQGIEDGTTPPKKRSGSDHIIPVEVLLIGRETSMRLYTDEVLKQAGFHVRAITPAEARGMIDDGAAAYSLVVFSNTLDSEDLDDIAMPLRQHNPGQKLLLMLGPDSPSVNFSQFDATLEGLEGPAALVRTVRRLAESAGAGGSASMCA